MREKTFRVQDVRKGLEMIKRQLGDQAVILGTKRAEDDLGRSVTDITVGVESSDLGGLGLAGIGGPMMGGEAASRASLASLEALISDLAGEIKSLRSQVRSLKRHQSASQVEPRRAGQVKASEALHGGQVRRMWADRADAGFGETVAHLFDGLLGNGLTREQVDMLIARAFQSECGWEAQPQKLREACRGQMANDIHCREPLWHSRAGRGEVALFVGPTGVGKTTTVAKVAAFAKTVGHKRVGVIAADSYRFGAVYQLERYGEILGFGLRVADSVGAFKRALEDFQDRDLILVDTTGQSPWQRDRSGHMPEGLALDRIAELAPAHTRTEICISATTQTRDAISLGEAYGKLPSPSLVFTKLDEAGCTGGLYAVPAATGLPVSHLCDGPVVPGDIRETTVLEIAQLAFTA